MSENQPAEHAGATDPNGMPKDRGGWRVLWKGLDCAIIVIISLCG